MFASWGKTREGVSQKEFCIFVFCGWKTMGVAPSIGIGPLKCNRCPFVFPLRCAKRKRVHVEELKGGGPPSHTPRQAVLKLLALLSEVTSVFVQVRRTPTIQASDLEYIATFVSQVRTTLLKRPGPSLAATGRLFFGFNRGWLGNIMWLYKSFFAMGAGEIVLRFFFFFFFFFLIEMSNVEPQFLERNGAAWHLAPGFVTIEEGVRDFIELQQTPS